MAQLPKFSVVTVSYNQGEFIAQNIESVLAQNYPNFEHIIVDGGSTDSTLEVLKRYPHLLWTSEPDRGQTHGLNKGFAKASGDIIAWLNSDDWYAPGIFHEVAEALKKYPLVMGACEKTDKFGNSTERIENIERGWFDLMKYWVFNAVPDQPAIFFTKEVLDSIKRPDGTWLDEDLEFTMDLDLWIRIAEKFSFNHRIPKTLAYYRMYEDNKTGRDMAGVYREMSRLFAHYGNLRTASERRLSYIIPVDKVDLPLEATLESIDAQNLKDSETLVAYYGDDDKSGRAIKRQVIDLGDKMPRTGVRYLRVRERNRFQALNRAIQSSGGTIFAVLEAGVKLHPDFTERASNIFTNDAVAIAFTNILAEKLAADIFKMVNGNWIFSVEGLFLTAKVPEIFLGRKLAFLDVGGFKSFDTEVLAMRELVLRQILKGWQLRLDPSLEIDPALSELSFYEAEKNEILQNYVSAKLIVELDEESNREPFAQIRKKHGFCVSFPEELVRGCRNLLATTPRPW